jgi:hypothetical protein
VAASIAAVKLTGAFFAGSLGLAACGRLVWHPPRPSRASTAAAVGAALLVAVTLLRGAILSGYPLYPLTILSIDADWRVPETQARAIHAFVTSWAQLRPTYDPRALGGWEWLLPWARATLLTDRFTIVLPLLIAVAGLALLARKRRLPMPETADDVPAWAIAMAGGLALASVVLWFFQAPAGRFGSIYFWIGMACLITWVLQYRQPPVRWMARPRVAASLCAALAVAQPLERLTAHTLRGRTGEVRSLFWLAVDRLPGSNEPQAVTIRETRSGLKVYHVKESRYETPLPNTRFFGPNLELRGRDLQAGFRNPSGDVSEYQVSIDLPDWRR